MTGVAGKFRIFLEMIKFEHSIFALPFAYLGLFLAADGWPTARAFLLVSIVMVTFRSMAMGANRILDRRIDEANPRTRQRAIPAGLLSIPSVWSLTMLFGGLYFAGCWALGPLCFQLSPIPFLLAWLYPFTKRFTWFSHAVLGIILGIAPYGAWLAEQPQFSWTPGFLTLGVWLWVAGFDIVYALQDMHFDRQAGLYSWPARFGETHSLLTARCLHAAAIVFWVLAGESADLGGFYWAGIALSGLFLVREHWIIHCHGLNKIQEAFFTMNAIISMTLFFSVLLDLFARGRLS